MTPTIRDYGKLRMTIDLDEIKALPIVERREWIERLWVDYCAHNEDNPVVFDAIACAEDLDVIVCAATGISFWDDQEDAAPEDLATDFTSLRRKPDDDFSPTI